MKSSVLDKLKILAESAKYDVSCASSGTSRSHRSGAIGSAAGWGICHSFAADGRCISLLKIMLTNYCMYDCAYCINRRSNDIPRATFSVSELVELTIEFYRRNYIEGLFLSSGVVRNPDYTMERMVRVAKDLRTVHHFNGYIHLKSIPGASEALVHEAGLYADRLSVNIEIPNEQSLQMLAPDKNFQSVFSPMRYIQQGVLQSAEERKHFRSAPRFAPAGQSTQMIIGATPDSDQSILRLSSALYRRQSMKRVYYSGYIHINKYDTRLPALRQAPLVRENRLYQADWLLRFYQFQVDEIVNDAYPNLDLEVDPKLSWALRHPEFFPVDINKADYELLLRIRDGRIFEPVNAEQPLRPFGHERRLVELPCIALVKPRPKDESRRRKRDEQKHPFHKTFKAYRPTHDGLRLRALPQRQALRRASRKASRIPAPRRRP